MIKVLITGASGFVGHHLVERLSQSPEKYDLTALVFGGPLIDFPQVKTIQMDLSNEVQLNEMIETIKPDWVFHLAALASPATSFHDNNKTLLSNIEIQANLLNSLSKFVPNCRVLVVGSAEEYGMVDPTHLPINESCPLRPLSPYAVSKLTQDFMGLQYFLSYKLPVVRVRPFNHVGEGQNALFALPAFAEQIAKIEAHQQEPVLRVGDLSATRDFTDVKDMVQAYELALEKGIPGEVYNLGSGTEIRMQDLLEIMIGQSNISIVLERDPSRVKPSDVPRLCADASKFRDLTSWQPTIPLEDTIHRVLDYWRKKIGV